MKLNALNTLICLIVHVNKNFSSDNKLTSVPRSKITI